MKIGFISDTHFRKETDFKVLDEVRSKVDLILSGGDWGVIPFSLEEARDMKPPIFSVAGNHDNPDVLRSYGMILEEKEINKINGLNVCAIHSVLNPAGIFVGGYGNRPFREFVDILKFYVDREDTFTCDILVLHDPPRYVKESLYRSIPGTAVYNNPSTAIVDIIISILRPRLVLCGHIHSKPYEYVEFPLFLGTEDALGIPTLMIISLLDKTYSIIDYNEKRRLVEKITVVSDGKEVFSVKPQYRIKSNYCLNTSPDAIVSRILSEAKSLNPTVNVILQRPLL